MQNIPKMIKKHLLSLILLSVLSTANAADVRYNYENISNGGTSFSSSSQTFNLTDEMTGIKITDYGSELNLADLGLSDGYMDTGFSVAHSGNVGGIDAPSGYTFRAKSFDVWPSANAGGQVLSTGELVNVIGIRNGVQVISANVAMVDFGQNATSDVRWHRIDLSSTVFNSTDIDAIQFVLINTQNYIAIDNFIYSDLQVENSTPVIGGTASGQAVNDNATVLPFTTVTIADADGDNLTITVTLDNNAKGVFTPASLTASGFTGTGPYSLASNSTSNVQTAIRLLDFNPANNRVNVGNTETTSFTIAIADASSGANNTNTSVISTSINDVGIASIIGSTTQGQTLLSGLTDADGITGSSFSYQWKRNTLNIVGANAIDYELTQDDVGKNITVTINYTDDLASVESRTSPATSLIANINDLPTINGTIASQMVDDTDTISPFSQVTIADIDGDNLTTSITLDINSQGIFTPASLLASGFSGSGPYTLASSSPSTVQVAIQQLEFDPTENTVPAGNTQTTAFTISVVDVAITVNNSNTTVIATSIDQNPTAVFDSLVMLEDAQSTVIDVLANDLNTDGGTLEVVSVVQPDDGMITNNTSNISYIPDSDYCNVGTFDTPGYLINGGSNAPILITVTCANDAPSFDVNGDIDATGLVAPLNTQYQTTNFTSNISFGPANESTQQISQYNVSRIDGSNVINTISLSNSGVLDIDFTLNPGVAIVQVTLQDDAGVANNGVDTSNVVEFLITYVDVVFENGFEPLSGLRFVNDSTNDFKVLDYLDSIQYLYPSNDYPVYDFDSDRLLFKGHSMSLNNDYSSDRTMFIIKNWIKEIQNYSSRNIY